MSNSSTLELRPPKPAWDGDPPQAAAARARLLEATSRCIERGGLAAASIAAIASEAGVSRQTVYRYFSGRDELAKRAIFATAEALLEKITGHIALLTDPADVIVEALVLGLAEIRSDRVLRAIWDSASPDTTVAEIFTHPTGIAWARHANARAIELAGWSEDYADTAMEFVLRIGLSLMISAPPERNDDELRVFLYRHLIPGLGLGAEAE
jgi:AcrR family transcriptional regulator